MNARTVHDGPGRCERWASPNRLWQRSSWRRGRDFLLPRREKKRVPSSWWMLMFPCHARNTISWYWQDQDPPRPPGQNTTLSSARTRPSLLALIPSNARKRKQASLPRGYTICTGQTATTLVYRGGVYSVLSRCQGHVASFRARLLDECTRQPARGASKLAAS
jgi:hypothetical protein